MLLFLDHRVHGNNKMQIIILQGNQYLIVFIIIFSLQVFPCFSGNLELFYFPGFQRDIPFPERRLLQCNYQLNDLQEHVF